MAHQNESDLEAHEAVGGQYLVDQRGTWTPERDALDRERSRSRTLSIAAFALDNLFALRHRMCLQGTQQCRRARREA